MEILIIPLIALAIFVLQYLFRGAQEEPRARGGRTATGPAPAREPQRPQPARTPEPEERPRRATDLDRFLEETRRRRQQREQPQTEEPLVVEASAPQARPGTATPPPLPADAGGQRPTRSERERRRRREEREPRRPTLVAVEEPARPRPTMPDLPPPPPPPPQPSGPTLAPSTSQPQAFPSAPTQPAAPTPAQATPDYKVSVRPSKVPPIFTEVLRLLRTPQGLGAAVVLNEIMTPAYRRKQTFPGIGIPMMAAPPPSPKTDAPPAE